MSRLSRPAFIIPLLLLAFCLFIPATPGTLYAQVDSLGGGRTPSPPREFFEPEIDLYQMGDPLRQLQQEVREIEDELNRLRMRIDEYDDLSSPRIRKEIKRLINLPEQISEIRLSNGTIVQGKIISENLDRVIVQTNIGLLSIEQENIVDLKPYDKLHADVKIDGDFEDQHHSDKRVFIGLVKNQGLRRADFVRVVYRLHDKRTHIVAQDSAYISGEPYSFFTGIISESSLSPGATAPFRVEVTLPPGTESGKISYVTYKVLFDEFN